MALIIIILGAIVYLACLVRTLEKAEGETVVHQHGEAVADMNNSQNNKEMNQENEGAKPDTRGLMISTLNQLGCQPTANEDGTLSVLYQGENFHMQFGGMYARVWDPMWVGFKADDPDMPKIREAVNAANFHFGPTVVMTTPNDDGVVVLHSHRDIMLHPACPDNVPYVQAVLNSFFDVREEVRNKFHQIQASQMEAQKNHRSVGFTANNQE